MEKYELGYGIASFQLINHLLLALIKQNRLTKPQVIEIIKNARIAVPLLPEVSADTLKIAVDSLELIEKGLSSLSV